MKIIYLGTPDFAVKPLKKLIENGYDIAAVVTQTDKPVGRKHIMTSPAVKIFAEENGLKVFQFEKIKNNAEDLRMIGADIMITCAYGQILTQEIIDICKFGIINIHASLLPKYRGSAPIQWSIINGDKITGITVMQTEKGLDTGDIILQKTLQIGEEETSGELFERLSCLGGEAIIEALKLIENGRVKYIKQDESKATKVKMLNKDDGLIDFNKSSKEINNLIRGLNPWPIAFFNYENERIKVFKAETLNCDYKGLNGEILFADRKNGLVIKTAEGAISIKELQSPNSKRMFVNDYLNGKNFIVGSRVNE